jgi:hypothetical protein
VVAGARDRSSCHPLHERCRVTRASAGEDRSARRRDVASGAHGLAAWRAWTLRNGRHTDYG